MGIICRKITTFASQYTLLIMINVQKLIQTKAFARQDGAILGLVWIASFVCTMLAVTPKYATLGLFSNLLLISTPFVVAARLRSFRDYALEGCISFRCGAFYCFSTFFNATLLLTVVQYLWFTFMDMGPFVSMIETTYPAILQEVYKISASEAKALLDSVVTMKPLAWASMFMISDLLAGAVLSPFIAAVLTRKAKPVNRK